MLDKGIFFNYYSFVLGGVFLLIFTSNGPTTLQRPRTLLANNSGLYGI